MHKSNSKLEIFHFLAGTIEVNYYRKAVMTLVIKLWQRNRSTDRNDVITMIDVEKGSGVLDAFLREIGPRSLWNKSAAPVETLAGASWR